MISLERVYMCLPTFADIYLNSITNIITDTRILVISFVNDKETGLVFIIVLICSISILTSFSRLLMSLRC